MHFPLYNKLRCQNIQDLNSQPDNQSLIRTCWYVERGGWMGEYRWNMSAEMTHQNSKLTCDKVIQNPFSRWKINFLIFVARSFRILQFITVQNSSDIFSTRNFRGWFERYTCIACILLLTMYDLCVKWREGNAPVFKSAEICYDGDDVETRTVEISKRS